MTATRQLSERGAQLSEFSNHFGTLITYFFKCSSAVSAFLPCQFDWQVDEPGDEGECIKKVSMGQPNGGRRRWYEEIIRWKKDG